MKLKAFVLALILALSVSPAHAQLTRILRGPLVVTSGGTPTVAPIGTVFNYTSAGTTTVTVNRTATINITAIAGGAGGNSHNGGGLEAYGGGGGGGGAATTGTSVTLEAGVTYEVIVGAAGAQGVQGSATAGGKTFFRISGSTIYVELNGGEPGGAFTGTNFPGGIGGSGVTGSNFVGGGAGGQGGDGGIAAPDNGGAGTAPRGGGGGGNGFDGPAGDGGASGSGSAGTAGSGSGGFGGIGGACATAGCGGGGSGGNQQSPSPGVAGTLSFTITAIF